MTLNRPKVFHHTRPAFRSFATDGNGQFDMAAGVVGLPEGNNSNGRDTKTGPNDPAESLTNPRHCRTFRAGFIALFIVALAAIAAWLVFTPDPPRDCSYSPVLKS
jgi:hypothetical protein